MRFPVLVLTTSLLLPACAADGGSEEDLDNNPPLASVDELLEGAPKADDIERVDYKTDEVLPAVHLDLLGVQSPVKSQGSRGVCSIFSTAGLMEHLYIVAGMENPDFSEQYLQWSAKFEVGSFPNSSGSNASYNLRAISDFGIVEESVWPYESVEWGAADDPACGAEEESDKPTYCFTNGHPSDEIKSSPKFFLPRSRWLHPGDIKRHIATEGTGVVAGMTFFYQAWNHRLSDLPTNSNSWNEGYVIAPSAKDQELSLDKRAGHSILLIGWDDTLELPVLDENGEWAVDENGARIVQKGCYIFKNSWGTTGFGIDSEWGPGYGCISYEYIERWASLRVSAPPVIELPDEVCGDGIDNDGNQLTDCEDPVCSAEPACQEEEGTVLSYEGEGGAIPDNDPVGIGSSITADAGTITKLTVDVDIQHTWRGDLRVTLHRGSDAVVLHDRTGGSQDDLVTSFEVTDFDGQDLAGEWRLVVVDEAGWDTGTLEGWTLTAVVE